MTRLGLALVLLPCLAALGAAQEPIGLSAGLQQCVGCAVPPRRQQGTSRGPAEGARGHEGPAELLERAESRHGEAAGRRVERHHRAARAGPALLHADRGRRGDGRHRQPLVLRRQQVRERRRSAGTRLDLLHDPGRAARPGARGLVLVEGDRHVAPRAGVRAARVRREDERALSRALPAARRRRGRDRLGAPGTRQRHPRQPIAERQARSRCSSSWRTATRGVPASSLPTWPARASGRRSSGRRCRT